MASVFDVARYVVKAKHSITTMKLQKLVYYCQALSLALAKTPLFPEDFEAWAIGPVCPPLYERQRGLFRLDSGFLDDIPDYDFTEAETDTMESVLEHYGGKSPEYLGQLAHSELPWKMARGTTPLGEPCHNIITKESMMFYYGGLIREEQGK